MFTGIVQDVGTISAIESRDGDRRVRISVGSFDLARQRVGDSIAVGGICLTVVALDANGFSADVSQETLQVTTAADWSPGRHVNLEAALRLGDALGGHLVAGHVDGIAVVVERAMDARSERMLLTAPQQLQRFLARKGSVTLDGVSLTINTAVGELLAVNLVPHTLAVTTLGELQPGSRVNLEVDLMARYAERLLGNLA